MGTIVGQRKLKEMNSSCCSLLKPWKYSWTVSPSPSTPSTRTPDKPRGSLGTKLGKYTLYAIGAVGAFFAGNEALDAINDISNNIGLFASHLGVSGISAFWHYLPPKKVQTSNLNLEKHFPLGSFTCAMISSLYFASYGLSDSPDPARNLFTYYFSATFLSGGTSFGYAALRNEIDKAEKRIT